MKTIEKVAAHIISNGKVNMNRIVKEVDDVGNYNRAAEIIDDLEKFGIIGSFNGYQPREVLIKDIEKAKILLTEVSEPEIIKPDGYRR